MAALGDDRVADEFEAALLWIMALEKMDCSILLNHILELKNQMIELQSKKAYAIKEADLVHDKEGGQHLLPEVQKESTTLEILELTHAKLNHRLYRDTFQKTTFNVQMQAAVHDSLREMNMDENVEASPEIRNLLEHHSNNFHTSKELLSLVDKKEKLEADILSAKMKYAELLGDIKKKWEIYQGKTMSSQDMEDEEIANYQRKIDSREGKVKIIIHIVQNMISSSGKLWGADDYYVQVLLLCDCALGHGSRSEVDGILTNIKRLTEARERGGPQPRQGKIHMYVSSTPSKHVKL